MGRAALRLCVLYLSVVFRSMLVLVHRVAGLGWRLRGLGLDVVDGQFGGMMIGGVMMLIGFLSRMLC